MLKISRTRQRQVLAACTIGSFVILIVAAVVGYLLFWRSSTDTTDSDKSPGVASEQSLRPNAQDRTRALFGPWESAAPGATGSPALVMLQQNGSIQVSSWTVEVDGSWKAGGPIEAINFSPGEGHITLETSFRRTFVVDYGQAFILETRPADVFAFVRTQTESVQLVHSTTEQVHLLGHKTQK